MSSLQGIDTLCHIDHLTFVILRNRGDQHRQRALFHPHEMALSSTQCQCRHFLFHTVAVLLVLIQSCRQGSLRKIIVEQEGISLRQIGSRQYDRSLVKGILRISETAQLDHFCTVLTELLRQLLRRLHIAELQHLCLDLDPSAEHLVEKALDEYRGILQNTGSRHERSLPLHSLEMPLLHEPQHGSTHCGTADAELVTELYFLGDHIAYRPFSRMDLVHNIFFDF